MTTAAATFSENMALARREFRERPLVMRSLPTFLGAVLTTRCHLDCAMCERVRVKGDLPADLDAKLRPLLPYLEQLHWQGGEVFMVPEFAALFDEAASHPELTQFIVTAGLLIDQAWAERLVRARCGLTISLDSAVAATYARIRAGGELEQLEQALSYLSEAEGRAGKTLRKTMHTVVMAENAGDVSSVIPFALENGFCHVDLTPRLPLDDAASLFAPANAGRFHAELKALAGQLELAAAQAKRGGLSLVDRVSPLLAPDARPAHADWDCWMPWRGLFINAEYDNGAVMPDCMCHPSPVGHVAKDDLLQVWNGAPMREYRRRVLAKDAAGWCNAACTSGGVNPAAWFASSFKRLSVAAG